MSELEEVLSHKELIEWKTHFDLEINTHTKQDWYLARIARYCHTMFSKYKGKDKNYLMSFKTAAEMEKMKRDKRNLRIKLRQALFMESDLVKRQKESE